MSVNKYKPHLYVIPEDDADRQIADGFVLHASVVARQVQVVEPAGGWARVLEVFKEEYVPLLQQNQQAHVVMLIDFDGSPDARRHQFDRGIPNDIRHRVFVIGPRNEPEVLRQLLDVGGFEEIGRSLAEECDNEQLTTWSHDQLSHNDTERQRMFGTLRPFLFSGK